jgi:hypothetical protein
VARSGHWADWPPHTELPIVRGTVIQISVEHLPGGRKPLKHIRLFHSAPTGTEPDTDLLWKAYLRRFDQEHFHRFAKVHLGLRAAHLASAAATDRWAQLAMVAYAQLRMASTMTDDLRRPGSPSGRPAPSQAPTEPDWDFADSAPNSASSRSRAGFSRRALWQTCGVDQTGMATSGRPARREARKASQPMSGMVVR